MSMLILIRALTMLGCLIVLAVGIGLQDVFLSALSTTFIVYTLYNVSGVKK